MARKTIKVDYLARVEGEGAFKVMVRDGEWKYIWIADGGREQLFHVAEDPHELRQRIGDRPEVAARLREAAVAALESPNAERALEKGRLRRFPYRRWPKQRIYQFDGSRGVHGFPARPADVLTKWKSA